ncbi:MAG: AraC family transcriptional regulator [Gordonia sp. (in: high G+C Gram-positive bacteria)]
MTNHRRGRHVLIVLPERVHLLDAAGPIQAFTAANDIGGAYTVTTLASTPMVTSHQGIAISAQTDCPRTSPDDLVIIPGWQTSGRQVPLDPNILAWVADHHAAGGHVASVCAGAFALAEVGILSGHTATTHHALVDDLARYSDITVLRDVLYTCGGRVHTSAGIASGIDLALHLIAHDLGPAVSARVARELVVPAWRRGAAGQVPITLAHRDHMDDLVHRAQDELDRTDEPIPELGLLAARVGVSGRTLARHFVRVTGLTPHAYGSRVRREAAEQLVSQGWTRESAARAVGWADARSLRRRASDH